MKCDLICFICRFTCENMLIAFVVIVSIIMSYYSVMRHYSLISTFCCFIAQTTSGERTIKTTTLYSPIIHHRSYSQTMRHQQHRSTHCRQTKRTMTTITFWLSISCVHIREIRRWGTMLTRIWLEIWLVETKSHLWEVRLSTNSTQIALFFSRNCSNVNAPIELFVEIIVQSNSDITNSDI